jgi:K+-transporting ATPase ATPase C chain
MGNKVERSGFFRQIAASGRIVLASMVICSLFYTLLILVIGQAFSPYTANGSLVRDDRGEIVGSELLAQGFSRPGYLWPRPSGVEYNASAAGGSNLSPANPALRARTETLLRRLAASADHPVPADLVTASGSGLDPHISLAAARYQAERIARARGLPVADILALLAKHAVRSGGALTPDPVVNVLLVNMALDRPGK